MAKIKITIIDGNDEHYFYYPDKSCKTEDGGMKMLLSYLKEIKEVGDFKVKLSLIE